MSAAPLLVFDLDGTLVDTAPDLIANLNALLAEDGLAELPLGEARPMIGAGVLALLDRGYAASGRALTPDRLKALGEAFIPRYAASIAASSRPFPGVEAALDRFAAAGWRFAVCTNKLESLSRRLLDELGLTPRFAAICGGDTFAVRKPDAAHLLGTIAKAGSRAERAVMVGDSKTDIDTARNAGVPVVAVDFGYTDVPVRELSPDRVISHFDALWDAVAEVGGLSPAPSPPRSPPR